MKVGLIGFYCRTNEYPTRYYLGTMRLAEYLLSFGINAEIIPIDLNDYEKFDYDIIINDYDLIGISNYSWVEDAVKYVSKKIQSINKNMTIVIGVPQVDICKVEEWNNEIFIQGEGEKSLLHLCKSLLLNESLENICSSNDNVFCKKYPTHNKIENKIEVGNPLFTNVNIPQSDRKFLWYETCRGCAFNCGYCGHRTRQNVDYFDLNIVEQEIKNIGINKFENVFIIDPNFAGTKERAKKVLDMFNKYAPNSKLGLYFRPEFIDNEMISILNNANIDCIRIGIQSTNKNVPLWLRSNSIKHIFNELPKLSKNHIKWRAELIVGLPGDNMQGLINSIQDIEKLNPYEYYCYHLTAIPGTCLYNLVNNFKLEHWIKINNKSQVIESDTYSYNEMNEMLKYSLIKSMKYNDIIKERGY